MECIVCFLHTGTSSNPTTVSSPAQRTVLHNALEASELTWSDPHLQKILDSDVYWSSSQTFGDDMFDHQGLPLWKGKCVDYKLYTA